MNTFIEFLRNNILHVAPILAMGAVCIAITLERVRALYLVYPLREAQQFFDKIRDYVLSDRLSEAIALCDRYPEKPVVRVVREAMINAHQPEPLIEDSLEIAVSESSQMIQKRTPFLATIANVATLMGLLGTILGLVQSFEAVGSASAQQRSALLAAGISTAMNATMLGLAVAIPSIILFAILVNRGNRLNAETQQAAMRSMRIIKQRFYSLEESAPGKGATQAARNA